MARKKEQRIEKAVDLYERFTGMEPRHMVSTKIIVPDVGMMIGKCDGVMYTTVRDGETLSYLHQFKGRSRPHLCASWDGKQIFFVGGAYDFTEEGIVDKTIKTSGRRNIIV